MAEWARIFADLRTACGLMLDPVGETLVGSCASFFLSPASPRYVDNVWILAAGYRKRGRQDPGITWG